jgi:hypothetical protein
LLSSWSGMQRRNVLTLIELFCCTALVGLLGCASLARPVPEPKPTDVNASFSRTWGAAVDYFVRSGVSVDTTDRSSGIIRADTTTMPPDRSHSGLCGGNYHVYPYWENGGARGWGLGYDYVGRPFGAPFTAIVHGDSTRATVSVTADWIDTHGKQIKCSASSRLLASEVAIKEKAEGRRCVWSSQCW